MPLNTSSLRNSLNGYLQLFSNRREVSTDTLNHHNDMVRKVAGVVEEYATKEHDTLASRTLSEEGKSTQLATLATATAPKLKFLERVVSSLDDDARATKEKLFTVKPPAHLGSDPLLQYLHGKEIRDRHRGLTQQEKDLAFLKASEAEIADDPDEVKAQANRDAVLWAFQETPGGPEIMKEVMQRALAERAKRLHPDTVARLHQVDLLHESLSGLRDSLVDWLRGLGGDPTVIFSELGGPVPPEPSIDVARRMVHAGL